MKFAVVGALLGLALVLPQAAEATTLVNAAFGGNLTAGSSAVRAPFNAAGSGITQGMSVAGSFVFDADQTPGAGTGFVLLPFTGLTDPDSAFSFTVGSLTFDLGDANSSSTGVAPAILFSNGVFNGFNYVSDFTYTDGLTYRLRFNSRNFTVRRIDPATGFNIGTTIGFQGNLGTGLTETPYVDGTPTGGVPEPSAWALMIVGLGGVGGVLRRRRHRLALA